MDRIVSAESWPSFTRAGTIFLGVLGPKEQVSPSRDMPQKVKPHGHPQLPRSWCGEKIRRALGVTVDLFMFTARLDSVRLRHGVAIEE
jgi:hypothetical protein